MAEALYRTYRPQTFADMVGQEHIERTLRNAITQDKVSHAYLFCGPRGTGKTTTARLLAKALLCEQAPTPEPEGNCAECLAIATGEHPDVYELDAASRTGVENVREEIIGRVQFAPTRGAKKIYVIDEVHMLSTAAFNALLKTLEEPPSHVVFILCTTDPHKVPETIHSRCQRFDFQRIAAEEIVMHLGAICVAEGVEFEGTALELIAYRAEGGMRNALTMLEQAMTYGMGVVSLSTVESLVGSLDASDLAQIVNAIGRRDVAACFAWTAAYIETGADLAQFARSLAERVRTMYILSIAGLDAPADISDAQRSEIAEELALFGSDRLARMLAVLGDLIAELKVSTNMRLSFEIALTRMVRPEADLTLAALAERIEELERRLAAQASVTVSPVSAPVSVSMLRTDDGSVSVPRLDTVLDASTPHTDGAPAPVSHSNTYPCEDVESARNSQNTESAKRTEDRESIENATTPSAMPASAPSTDACEGHKASVTSKADVEHKRELLLSDPGALQRIWQKAIAVIKREKAAYAALLTTVQVSYDVVTQTIVLAFPTKNTFAFKAMQRPEATEAIATALTEVFGQRLAFLLIQSDVSDGSDVVTSVSPVEAPTAVLPTEKAVPSSKSDSTVVYDEVPIDLYDEGYASSYGDKVPVSISSTTLDALVASTEPLAPISAPVSDGRGSPKPATDASQTNLDRRELERLLISSFGEGVVIEEA